MDINPVFETLALKLIKSPVLVDAEIPIPPELWELEIFDVAAYLGLLYCLGHRTFKGYPPVLVWGSLVAYLEHAALLHDSCGMVEECMRRARQNTELSAVLFCEISRRPAFNALYEVATADWPLKNVVIEKVT